MRRRMNKAQFRATRDMLGLSQQQVADMFGVNIVTVKRWERPDLPYAVPDGVAEKIAELSRVQDRRVDQAVSEVVAAVPTGGIVRIVYYRSQGECGEGGLFGMANANARLVAARLKRLGYQVEFVYSTDNV